MIQQYITPEDIIALENVPKRKTMDGRFVRMCIQKIYKGNEQVLENRTLCGYPRMKRKLRDGTIYQQEQKLCMTPIKVKIIHSLMKNRLQGESQSETMLRLDINQKIANAINTITRANE